MVVASGSIGIQTDMVRARTANSGCILHCTMTPLLLYSNHMRQTAVANCWLRTAVGEHSVPNTVCQELPALEAHEEKPITTQKQPCAINKALCAPQRLQTLQRLKVS
jgi:hypothetical protein